MPADTPNILFIMTDQWNESCFSAYNHPDVKTPNIDNFIKNGVAFRRCYCQSAICQPSRISFLSSQYLHTHGVMQNNQEEARPREHCVSLVGHIRERLGYTTGAIGKLHLGVWQNKAGFDKIVSACDDVEKKEPDYFAYLRKHDLLGKYERVSAGAESLFRFHYGESKIPVEHSNENFTADETIKFIEESQGRPFFCWTTFERPHSPHYVPYDFHMKYDPEKLVLPDNVSEDFESKPFHKRPGVENSWKSYVLGEKELRQGMACYYGLMSLIDFNIGRIIDYLRQNGLLDNTIIIFSADHGDFAGNYGMLGKNTPSVDVLYRVPYIWYWGNKFAKDRVYGLTESIDLLPTLCEILNLPIPPEAQGEEHTDALFTKDLYEGKEAVFFENVMVKCVRTQEYKLSFTYDRKAKGELYDMVNDPWEASNLFNSPQHSHIQKELMERLLGWYIRTELPETVCPLSERIPRDWRWHQHIRKVK